ncbi:MAG TPA: glycosyltransferase family 2 protein [Stellaceae bacterium]|nr:glycosyltransferase family 2 protein [Stellaceae bacterium]
MDDLQRDAELRLPGGREPGDASTAELAVVIPTLNEVDNVAIIVERLAAVLDGVHWEAIFVDDDSADGTADRVREIARARGNIRCLQRLGRRGLASACIEGVLASAAPYVAVMDGDLQHDESLIPAMLAAIKERRLDVVVASRHKPGGGLGDWQRSRVRISDIASRLGRLVIKAELSDPMSGFFLIERGAFEKTMRGLSGQGFKLLLDIFASSPVPLAFAELPYRFRRRLHGESKLDTLVAWEYLMLLLDKLTGGIVPVRFLLFGLIGGLGILTHLATLWAMLRSGFVDFPAAQGIATVVAMTGNFLLNNLFTYRDRRLKGWRILTGLLSFYAVCGVGAAANVGVAFELFGAGHAWWLAGLGGAAVGVVWNYAVSSLVTWNSGGLRRAA